MSDSTLTLAALLGSPPDVDPAKMGLASEAGASTNDGAGFLRTKISEGLSSALGVDVMALIAEAWAKTDDVRRAASAQRGSGQPAHLFLAKHDIACDNKLDVTLEVLGAPAITDHLSLRLKAMFEGVGVTIDHDCIVAVDAGRGAAKAELLYSDASLLSESSDWIALPAKWVLRRPIRIAGGDSP